MDLHPVSHRDLLEPTEADALEPIPFNKRRGRRAPAEGWAVATLTNDEGGRSVCGVRLVDSTAGGVGVLSPVSLAPGSSVVMHFEGQRTPSRWGTVRWCEQSAVEPDSYRVGIECEAYERVSA